MSHVLAFLAGVVAGILGLFVLLADREPAEDPRPAETGWNVNEFEFWDTPRP